MDLLMGITSGIRNIRGEMNVPPSLRVEATVQSPDEEVRQALEEHGHIIVNLSKLRALRITPPGERPLSSATSVLGEGKELDGVGKKLRNEDFLNKAPREVVEGVRANRERLDEKKNKLENQLRTVSRLAGGP
jgi:valyl-tRNA synthetase